jgi:glycosyltransferase involved in cell wall biosynthesis
MSPSAIDVSVIIPAHNAALFICDAVDSALQQTGVTLEVIVVDNCSTDRTRQIVEHKYHSSVQVVHESRLGIGHARNAGIRLAAGEYIALLDSDDIWLPGKLRRQISELTSRPETGLVFCHGHEFRDPNLTSQQCTQFTCRPEPYAFLIPSALLAARTTFLEVGDFPDVPVGEFIAWYGWAQSLGLQTFVIPEILVRRRVHARNTSRGVNVATGYVQAAKWLMDRRRQAL